MRHESSGERRRAVDTSMYKEFSIAPQQQLYNAHSTTGVRENDHGRRYSSLRLFALSYFALTAGWGLLNMWTLNNAPPLRMAVPAPSVLRRAHVAPPPPPPPTCLFAKRWAEDGDFAAGPHKRASSRTRANMKEYSFLANMVNRFAENGISTVLEGGSLLGARRHFGVIPWDTQDFDLMASLFFIDV